MLKHLIISFLGLEDEFESELSQDIALHFLLRVQIEGFIYSDLNYL